MPAENKNTLAQHLIATAGHLGRASPEMKRIAKRSKLSVHSVQSLAMGRRQFFPDNMKKLRRALGKEFQF